MEGNISRQSSGIQPVALRAPAVYSAQTVRRTVGFCSAELSTIFGALDSDLCLGEKTGSLLCQHVGVFPSDELDTARRPPIMTRQSTTPSNASPATILRAVQWMWSLLGFGKSVEHLLRVAFC